LGTLEKEFCVVRDPLVPPDAGWAAVGSFVSRACANFLANFESLERASGGHAIL